ncbi:hypothetical protein MRB53_008933 [Persea americana]|uniref:Uncharacterized protein n=1 Tax=Persea americana TaxID=3435 RepID=A0ACC2LMM5_PERAE|nr:hypothetical protein MRB53_008933 [Persea americana]
MRSQLRPDPEKGTLPLGAWSKILREDYKDSRRDGIDGDSYEEEESDGRIPHEFLARQLASMRISYFSLHKGVGSLTGRDLSRRDVGPTRLNRRMEDLKSEDLDSRCPWLQAGEKRQGRPFTIDG